MSNQETIIDQTYRSNYSTVYMNGASLEVDKKFQTYNGRFLVVVGMLMDSLIEKPYFTAIWDGKSKYWLEGEYDLSQKEAWISQKRRSSK